MPRTRLASSIDLSGPFFRKNPARTFRENVKDLMDAVAREGEEDVRVQMQSGEGSRQPMRGISPARVSGHVVGRTSSLGGKRWKVTAVVSVNNSGLSAKQGISLMAAGSVVEGQTGAFKRTLRRLRKAKALNTAELLKGLK